MHKQKKVVHAGLDQTRPVNCSYSLTFGGKPAWLRLTQARPLSKPLDQFFKYDSYGRPSSTRKK